MAGPVIPDEILGQKLQALENLGQTDIGLGKQIAELRKGSDANYSSPAIDALLIQSGETRIAGYKIILETYPQLIDDPRFSKDRANNQADLKMANRELPKLISQIADVRNNSANAKSLESSLANEKPVGNSVLRDFLIGAGVELTAVKVTQNLSKELANKSLGKIYLLRLLFGTGIGVASVAATADKDTTFMDYVAGGAKGLRDAAFPGLFGRSDEFDSIKDIHGNTVQRTWVDHTLNIVDTVTGSGTSIAYIGAGVCLAIGAFFPPALIVAGAFFAVANAGLIANFACSLFHDVMYWAGAANEGGIITGGGQLLRGLGHKLWDNAIVPAAKAVWHHAISPAVNFAKAVCADLSLKLGATVAEKTVGFFSKVGTYLLGGSKSAVAETTGHGDWKPNVALQTVLQAATAVNSPASLATAVAVAPVKNLLRTAWDAAAHWFGSHSSVATRPSVVAFQSRPAMAPTG